MELQSRNYSCRKRESLHLFGHEIEILEIISNDNVINNRWSNYQSKFSFAKEISFDETVARIRKPNHLFQTTTSSKAI